MSARDPKTGKFAKTKAKDKSKKAARKKASSAETSPTVPCGECGGIGASRTPARMSWDNLKPSSAQTCTHCLGLGWIGGGA